MSSEGSLDLERAIPGTQVAAFARLNGLEQGGRDGHVLEIYQRFQNFDHFAHQRPGFRIPAEALVRKLDGLMRGFDGEMALETRVYELVEASSSSQIGTSPFHEIVLARRPLLVHGSAAGQNFEEDDSEAVDITL